MPTDVAILQATPGSRARTEGNAPPASAPAPNNSAPPRSPFAKQPNQRLSDARAKLAEVGQGMAAGKFQEGAQPVTPEGRASLPASAVTDSPGMAPSPTPNPAPTPAPAKKEAKEPTAEEKAAAEKRTKDIAAAKRALALDGWEPEDIEALKEDKLLKMGSHRARNQADVNREFQKLKDAAAGIQPRNTDGTFGAKDPKDAPPAKKDDATPPAKPAQAETDADLVAMVDEIAEEIGAPATKVLKAMATVFDARLRASRDSGTAALTEMLYNQGADIAAQLYPEEMANPKNFDEVAENFSALMASGRYGRGQISKCWKDACHMQFGPPNVTRKAQRDMLARQAAADAGRVDAGRGDSGDSSLAPTATGRQALNMAAALMANANGKTMEQLRGELSQRMGRG